ncbi:MAG: alpha/beta hydrolase [Anaerolineae bacterium]|nr:alpha/beta hydrolase [Anaerolineae bacterium]
MPSMLRFVFVIALLLSVRVGLAQSDAPTFQMAPCPFNRPGGVAIECGYVTVTESRSPALADDTNQIRLAVAVFKSTSTRAEPDPVIYLDGGPGGHTLDSVEYMVSTFQPMLLNHDVIFFDQRGVGFSGGLDCPAYIDFDYAILDQDMPFDEVIRQSNEVLLKCRDENIPADVNLAAYTTTENAADVRDIIQALGYSQANLIGVSYGTRLALTVMRDHPEVVRSAVIDAVLPLQVSPDAEFPVNAQRAFKTLFDGCAQDHACNLHYPDLETVFYDTVDKLNDNPETVTAFDFYSGQKRAVLVNGDLFIGGLFGLLYQTTEIPNLPRYIYEASQGTYDGFLDDLFFMVYQDDYFDETLFTNIGCYEETAFEDLDTAQASSAGLPAPLADMFLSQVKGDFELCAAWGAPPVPATENDAVISDIPTLVTVGEYDPITPPAWARLAASTLSQSYVYEFPAIGHSALFGTDCAVQITTAFINDPNQEPDASCIANLPPPLFATAEIVEVHNQPYTSDELGFRGIVPENWFEVEPGVFSPYPQLDPVQIPVIAYRFPVTLDDYISRIITQGFYAYDKLPPSTSTVSANGRDWQIYQIERPDEKVYTSFAFFEGDRTYVIGVTANSAEERAFLYDALFIPAIQAFEIVEPRE